mmetsp:Transcript_42688/g.138466  ORF Transcript_42688/g.138466 Transcript_42688/m.138466 type:complete len:219 (-) Transcript_42688:93-749(-)
MRRLGLAAGGRAPAPVRRGEVDESVAPDSTAVDPTGAPSRLDLGRRDCDDGHPVGDGSGTGGRQLGRLNKIETRLDERREEDVVGGRVPRRSDGCAAQVLWAMQRAPHHHTLCRALVVQHGHRCERRAARNRGGVGRRAEHRHVEFARVEVSNRPAARELAVVDPTHLVVVEPLRRSQRSVRVCLVEGAEANVFIALRGGWTKKGRCCERSRRQAPHP